MERDRHRQLINYHKASEKKQKEMNLVKNLKKEVNIGANGTQRYIVKEGANKGKII